MSNADSSKKRKRVMLSLNTKLKILDKLELGVLPDSIMKEYNIGKTTVSDLKRNKAHIRSVAYSTLSGFLPTRKTLKQPNNVKIDEAVLRWYNQQKSLGVCVRGGELKNAASRYAELFNVPDFKASEGWLWRFRHRHGLHVKDKTDIKNALELDPSWKPFPDNLNSLINFSGLLFSQVYNANETKLFWKSFINNKQAVDCESVSLDEKVSQENFSALLCANADGSHRLPSFVVDKSMCPRILRSCIKKLPVHYFSSSEDGFTQNVFKEWFFNHFIPEIQEFQTKSLNIPENETQALLLLKNTCAHPCIDELCSEDGKIRCILLPSNTVQPMEGITKLTKRLYRRKYLEEVLTILEDENKFDQRRQKTLINLKNYNVKSALYNWASAWQDVKVSRLASGWQKLLNDDLDLADDGLSSHHHFLPSNGENEYSEEGSEEDSDPEYDILQEEQIAQVVTKSPNDIDDDNDQDSEVCIKLSEVKELINGLINFIDNTEDNDFQEFYQSLWQFRKLTILKQHQLHHLSSSKSHCNQE